MFSFKNRTWPSQKTAPTPPGWFDEGRRASAAAGLIDFVVTKNRKPVMLGEFVVNPTAAATGTPAATFQEAMVVMPVAPHRSENKSVVAVPSPPLIESKLSLP